MDLAAPSTYHPWHIIIFIITSRHETLRLTMFEVLFALHQLGARRSAWTSLSPQA